MHFHYVHVLILDIDNFFRITYWELIDNDYKKEDPV